MSPHARWRNLRIVNPTNANREEELAGGLKNALERGETILKAKQSFLNSGYGTQEIQNAIQKIHPISAQIKKPTIQQNQAQTLPNQTPLQKQTPTKKHSSTTVIILVIIGVIILITALTLGLFWERIF